MSPAETKLRTIGQHETSSSLDTISHPGRPAPDELVPSRYALRVGVTTPSLITSTSISPTRNA